MEGESAGLSEYISEIHYEEDYRLSREKIFDYGICHNPPLLRKGRCNRIIVYPGSFNPPHLGHMDLLRYGFESSGDDLNVIAAIILPLDDSSLQDKFRGEPTTKIFNKDQRVMLWKGVGASDWFWVYDRSIEEWYIFQDRLTKAIVRDGFDVKFICLFGAEFFGLDPPPPRSVWGCKEILVSDISQSTDFTSFARNCLKTLGNYEPWEEIHLDEGDLRNRAEESSHWVFGGLELLGRGLLRSTLEEDPHCVDRLTNELFDKKVEAGRAIRVCRHSNDSECTIRIVPRKTAEPGTRDISSTLVRAVMRMDSGDSLRRQLEKLVLNPEILMGFISEKTYCP